MKKTNKYVLAILLSAGIASCAIPKLRSRKANTSMPVYSSESKDTANSADVNWRNYFQDSNLVALIDTALMNNQELNIMLQEIEASRYEIKARKGEYLPFVRGGMSSGMEKPGLYTTAGATEKQLMVKPGTHFPEPLGDHMLGLNATWELDIWKKLRNAKKAAAMRYLATIEGRNFMVTNLVAEISSSYFELMAADNLLEIIDKNIAIQTDALSVVKQQKLAAKVTQLAVNRFEAQLLNTQNLQYVVKQKIVEIENRINFLKGGISGTIRRSSAAFIAQAFDSAKVGLPSQLLRNRPDIKQAEWELTAAGLDVKSARARFYPSVGISAGMGFQAFNMAYLVNPESLLYNLAGDLVAPLVNRNAIAAAYGTAGARQVQAAFNYEKTILNAYLDVLNQLNKVKNYTESVSTKSKEVAILVQSIGIANNLFNSARADYAEVLLTQREALDAKIDLVEARLNQLNARVSIYRALGGGWK